MKKVAKIGIGLIILVFLIVILTTTYYLLMKPDLVVLNVTSSEEIGTCEYTIEIKNIGRSAVNDVFYLCTWPEGYTKPETICNKINVVNRDLESNTVIFIKPGETYNFTHYENCKSKLHMYIDRADEEEHDNKINELNEENNYFLYIR